MFGILKNIAGDGNAKVPPLPDPRSHSFWEGPLPVQGLLVAAGLAVGGIFALFQLHLLSKSWARVVSKVYFWPVLPFTMLKASVNYWTEMDDTIYLGAAPIGFLGHADMLSAKGVKGVINMCEEYKGPVADYELLGIEHLWLPTVDHFEPELEFYFRGVDFIKRFQKRGEKVLIHCKAGHGRSAAIAMGWMLASDPRLTPLEVQRNMLSKRRVRSYLYRQFNLRIFYRSLHMAADGSGKDRETIYTK